jgi:hypothetical protein
VPARRARSLPPPAGDGAGARVDRQERATGQQRRRHGRAGAPA